METRPHEQTSLSVERLCFRKGGRTTVVPQTAAAAAALSVCETTLGMKPLRPSVTPETSVVGDLKLGLGILIPGSSWGCLNVQSWLRALA